MNDCRRKLSNTRATGKYYTMGIKYIKITEDGSVHFSLNWNHGNATFFVLLLNADSVTNYHVFCFLFIINFKHLLTSEGSFRRTSATYWFPWSGLCSERCWSAGWRWCYVLVWMPLSDLARLSLSPATSRFRSFPSPSSWFQVNVSAPENKIKHKRKVVSFPKRAKSLYVCMYVY